MSRGAVWREDVSLRPLTTYKVGGTARYYARATSTEDIGALVTSAPAAITVLGRGSNVVIADRGIPGAVLHVAGGDIAMSGASVVADAGVPLSRLARETVNEGRRGLEFMVGIPGSVGGAVVMNAGCHGSETRERLVGARLLDLDTATVADRSPEELAMGYRSSNVTERQIVIDATFHTRPGKADAATAELRRITAWRRRSQPGGSLNAGSVFKNPPEDSAGRLIDVTGLKGLRIGGAEVSAKHANFIVAADEARADDVWRLVWAVRRRVAEAFGVVLEPELRFFGEFEPCADREAV
ncbi:MAG: UDP-N-acetylmuramate dehydrogenase [Acidimicrobiia bacterium]